jgi:DNA-binding GntR family transcriptional regulator
MPATGSRISLKLQELSDSLGRQASVSDRIAELIQNLIFSGDLKPGDRVVESRIARQLGVGQPTVREALAAVEHKGLVVRMANQGCAVTTLTRSEVEQILRIRDELEMLAVELTVENARDDELHKLIAIAGQMKAAARARNVEDFFQHDLRFHETLWELSGNAFLPKLLSQLMLPLLAFLFIRNMRSHSHIDMVASADAHVQIVESIMTGDKKLARRVAQEKFQMFADQHMALYPQ